MNKDHPKGSLEPSALRLVCSSGAFEATKGEGTVVPHPQTARIRMALMRGLAGITLTALSVFIPAVHFFSVPFGLLVTSVLITKALGRGPSLEGAVVTCPACKQAIRVSSRPLRFPFADVCESCRRSVNIAQDY